MNRELLETIKIENGHIINIEWHNQRFNKSRKALFRANKECHLQEFINAPKKGVYRCRVLYDKEINTIEYLPYVPKAIKKIKIVPSRIEYGYKYSDRSELQSLIPTHYDDVLIQKDGLLTDTSMANIAFYNGEEWLTPKYPLLEGTLREKLLDENFLKLKDIQSNEIQSFSHFALMNAMIGFKIQKSITIRL